MLYSKNIIFFLLSTLRNKIRHICSWDIIELHGKFRKMINDKKNKKIQILKLSVINSHIIIK